MQLKENVYLGLDLGIGSIGWALVEYLDNGEYRLYQHEKLLPLGVRMINIPEKPKDKTLLNVERRNFHRQRITIKRKAQRMKEVRNILTRYGFDCAKSISKLHHSKKQINPWYVRKIGLERLLTDEEFTIALIHMAKHRGFQSNSKNIDSDKEQGKMLGSIKELQKKMAESSCVTVGSYLASLDKQRNKADIDGNPVYTNTILRDLLREESTLLFKRQQSFGQKKATSELLEAYKKIAFEQRPLQSTTHLVGYCTFLPEERRAPKFSPTSEQFRLVQKLVNIRFRLSDGSTGILTPEIIHYALDTAHKKKNFTYNHLRTLAKLPESASFIDLDYSQKDKKGKLEDPEKNDLAKKTDGSCKGSYTLYKILGEESYTRLRTIRCENKMLCLDAIAKILSDNDSIPDIENALYLLPITTDEKKTLIEACHEGKVSFFKGTLNLSLKAMELIIPSMIKYNSYDKGCADIGFIHSQEPEIDPTSIKNHVVAHLFKEFRKQVQTIMHEFNIIPGKVCIELSRDVGKSKKERDEIDKGIKKRTDQKNNHRKEFAELCGREPDTITPSELLKYELWKQQGGKCAYYNLWKNHSGNTCYAGNHGSIHVENLQDSVLGVEVDHILPLSRCWNDSFRNKCLCYTSANQKKGNRTPFEWLGKNNPETWIEYKGWVESLPIHYITKKNFCIEDLSVEKQNAFISRNINDTRYISKVMMQWLKSEYSYLIPNDKESSKKRRVFSRTGTITSFLRKEWGLEGLKKDSLGNRIGDRHHALDAFVIACCTESQLEKVTKLHQDIEEKKIKQRFPPPFKDCRKIVSDTLNKVFVSRAEKASTKGQAHDATLYSLKITKNEEGKEVETIYQRERITNLTEKDLDNIKDPERNKDIIKSLKKWLTAGKPKDEHLLPRTAKGDIIKRVTLILKNHSGLRVPRGDSFAFALGNGKMVRTDVYKKGEKYYLVPVYVHQVAKGITPNKAIVNDKPEEYWLTIDDSFEFLFSLTPNCYVIIDRNGKIDEGYFIGTDRNTACIKLAAAYDRTKCFRISVKKNVNKFEKYHIDRFGRLCRVKKEQKP